MVKIWVVIDPEFIQFVSEECVVFFFSKVSPMSLGFLGYTAVRFHQPSSN